MHAAQAASRALYKSSQCYSQTEGNDMLNRCDFRCVLKVENVKARRRSTGRLFQACGPAMARARSPMVECRIADTRTSAVDADRESTSDSGWINWGQILWCCSM